MSTRGSAADKGKTQKAADWLIATPASKEARDEASGVDGQELKKQAKADGAFGSVSTWDRAVKLARLQVIGVLSRQQRPRLVDHGGSRSRWGSELKRTPKRFESSWGCVCR